MLHEYQTSEIERLFSLNGMNSLRSSNEHYASSDYANDRASPPCRHRVGRRRGMPRRAWSTAVVSHYGNIPSNRTGWWSDHGSESTSASYRSVLRCGWPFAAMRRNIEQRLSLLDLVHFR